MTSTYYVVALQFLILTCLIIWQTVSLINVIKIMGERLEREKVRLRILMIMFSASYIGITSYYIVQVTTGLNCAYSTSCVRFIDLMSFCVVLSLFDLVPTFVLYWQHYQTSSESLRQLQQALARQEEEKKRGNSNDGVTKPEQGLTTRQTVPSTEDFDRYETIHLVPIESSSSTSHAPPQPSPRGLTNLLVIGEASSAFEVDGEGGTMSHGSFVHTVKGTVCLADVATRANDSFMQKRNNLSSSPNFGAESRAQPSYSFHKYIERHTMHSLDNNQLLRSGRRSLGDADVPLALGFRPDRFVMAV